MTRERQAMMVQHMLRNQAHQQRLSALRNMTQEERDAFFNGCDAIFARTDAIKANNWAQYLYLGGHATVDNILLAAKQGRWMEVK